MKSKNKAVLQPSTVHNTFSILSSILNEKALTEALRYLLDSNESHRLGDKFFRAFVNLLPKRYKIGNEPCVVTATGQWSTDEERRIDISVVARKSWACAPHMVIGIEGKINSQESYKQISAYQKDISRKFAKATRRAIIFPLCKGIRKPWK